MTNYRWKAETELWMSDPEYWVWQEFYPGEAVWTKKRIQHPPPASSPVEARLVPRPWLEEPEKWEVWFRPKSPEYAWARHTSTVQPEWNHKTREYELRPRTAYQARVEIPAPETEAPGDNTMYYVPTVEAHFGYRAERWNGFGVDTFLLEKGLVYLTPENAAARSEAMRKIEPCAG